VQQGKAAHAQRAKSGLQYYLLEIFYRALWPNNGEALSLIRLFKILNTEKSRFSQGLSV
jgi:hypothetical protein